MPESKHKYRPDFELPNGILVEAKGRLTFFDRAKMLLVIKANPDKDIRLLFMRDNKLTKKSKQRYTDWARANGIKCHVSDLGSIPEAWIAEKNKKSE